MSETALAPAMTPSGLALPEARWITVAVGPSVAHIRDVFDGDDFSLSAQRDLNRVRMLGLARPTVEPRGIPTR